MTYKIRIIVFLFFPFGLFTYFTNTQTASAASTSSACKITQSSLNALKTPSQTDYLESVKSELKLRKDLLYKVIDCAIIEASEAKAELSSMKAEGTELQAAQKFYSREIEEAINLYKIKRAAVENSGIQGTQDIARDIKTWKSGNYAPAAAQASNIVLWFKNEALFSTARARLEQVRSSMKNLKIPSTSSDIQDLLEDARGNLDKALILHADTKAGIKNYDNPTLVFEKSKESLEKLSEMYKNLFALSDAIKKLITK